EKARYPVIVCWEAGFYEPEGTAEKTWRWCGREGRLVLHNLRSKPVPITLTMTLRSHSEQPSLLSLQGDVLSEEVWVNQTDLIWNRLVPLRPGRNVIQSPCDGPRLESRGDPRELVFSVWDFIFREE